jgi:uncharacterized membrane protein
MLDEWTGKLTWDLLIDQIERELRVRYTRQALFRYESLKLAFAARKKAVSQAKDRSRPADEPLDEKSRLVEVLKAENARLKLENQRLIEQFIRWAYNAYALKKMSKDMLDRPLPEVDRERSKTKGIRPA